MVGGAGRAALRGLPWEGGWRHRAAVSGSERLESSESQRELEMKQNPSKSKRKCKNQAEVKPKSSQGLPNDFPWTSWDPRFPYRILTTSIQAQEILGKPTQIDFWKFRVLWQLPGSQGPWGPCRAPGLRASQLGARSRGASTPRAPPGKSRQCLEFRGITWNC